jgi:hypothetical protein
MRVIWLTLMGVRTDSMPKAERRCRIASSSVIENVTCLICGYSVVTLESHLQTQQIVQRTMIKIGVRGMAGLFPSCVRQARIRKLPNHLIRAQGCNSAKVLKSTSLYEC